MSAVVVDASAVAEYVLVAPRYARVAVELERAGARLHAPSLCDLEVVSTLRYGLLRRDLTVERAAEALANYLALPITRHRHASLLERVLQLRENFTAYDACYVALAERLEAPLLTLDRRLAAAVARHVPGIELVV